MISDAELSITKREHDLGALNKEKTTAENLTANLEKQYDWIIEEREYVYGHSCQSAGCVC